MKIAATAVHLALIGLISLSLGSCKTHKATGAVAPLTTGASPGKPNVTDYAKMGYIKATVIRLTLDGCGYLLQLDSGKKLEAQNLAEEFKKEKLVLWIKYEPAGGNVASICMAGDIVRLTDCKVAQ